MQLINKEELLKEIDAQLNKDKNMFAWAQLILIKKMVEKMQPIEIPNEIYVPIEVGDKNHEYPTEPVICLNDDNMFFGKLIVHNGSIIKPNVSCENECFTLWNITHWLKKISF